jgi:hypothetical protein
VTEDQWQNCGNPDTMLDTVAGSPSATDRRLRLFSCACVRRVWDLLQGENEAPLRRALEFAQRLAEGGADTAQRAAIDRELRGHPIVWAEAGWDLIDAAIPHRTEPAAVEFAVLAAELAFRDPVEAKPAARFAAWAEAARTFLVTGSAHAATCLPDNIAHVRAAGLTAHAASFRRQELQGGEWVWVPDEATAELNGYAVLAALADVRREQCGLVREFFGPVRLIAPDPAWLAWNGGTVRGLAESILRDQAFERMPVLGDALEDAGCQAGVVLAHCRGPGLHTRGCWVIDWLTGRG